MPYRAIRVVQAFALAAIVLVVVTCGDSSLLTPSGPTQPAFAISDGSTGGNPDLFFFPPLVETPDPSTFVRPANPNLVPVVKVCTLNSTDECVTNGSGDTTFVFQASMTFSTSDSLYKVNWQTGQSNLLNNTNYRIHITVGSVIGYRDIVALDGPSVGSCTTQDAYCHINRGSNVPIKVRIGTGALCADPAGLCASASFDLSQGGSLGLQRQSGSQLETIATADVNATGTAGQISTITMQPCVTPGGTLASVLDIPLFGDCVEIDADDLPVTGVASLCTVADGGLPPAQAQRITIHRANAVDMLDPDAITADDLSSWRVVALPDADANCPPPTTLGFSTLDRLRLFARDTWRSAKRLLSPPPLLASICNRGCGGSTPFESSFQAGLPTWAGYGAANPAGNLGTHDVGTVVSATVRLWDSGEGGAMPDPVNGARVTVTVTPGSNGEVSDGSGGPFAKQVTVTSGPPDAAGTVTFYLNVGPGLNTIEVTGRGIGDPGTNPPTKAFAPLHGSGSATEVTLGVGRLTFTAMGRVPLEFDPDPPQNPVDGSNVFLIDATTGVALVPVTICTIPRNIEGVPITNLEFIKNNGDPVMVGGWSPSTTGANGCQTFDITINKTGAYRVVVNDEITSQKINVKPPLKK